MKLSFEGIRSNALRQFREIEKLAKQHEDYDEYEHQALWVESCISAYHDCLLAVMRGDTTPEALKDFLLAFKTQKEIDAMPYCGEVVSFNKNEATQ